MGESQSSAWVSLMKLVGTASGHRGGTAFRSGPRHYGAPGFGRAPGMQSSYR